MKRHTESCKDVFRKAADIVQSALASHLSHAQKFLLLLSGGSAVHSHALLTHWLAQQRLSSCAVALVDERYGEPGHAGSNAVAIEKSGLFAPFINQSARVEYVLHGRSPAAETDSYARIIDELFRAYAGHIVGVFGIGADGHTAGIFPTDTPEEFARLYQTGTSVVSHELGAVPYQHRITIAPQTIARIADAVVIARGEEKQEALRCLNDLAYPDTYAYRTPALLLRRIPNVAVVSDLK